MQELERRIEKVSLLVLSIRVLTAFGSLENSR